MASIVDVAENEKSFGSFPQKGAHLHMEKALTAPAGLRRLAGRGAACLSAYVAIGGLAGFLLARNKAPFRFFAEGTPFPPSCWPELALFDAIQTRCQSGLHDLLWFMAVGLPRLVLAFPIVATLVLADPSSRQESIFEVARFALIILAIGGACLAVFVWGIAVWRRQSVWAAGAIALFLILDEAAYAGRLFIWP
jgi:hypothetical protein